MALPKKIVDIQERREQEALKIFIDKKQIYERLKAAHDEQIKALDDFKLWRIQETNRVFEELKANPLPKKELDKKKQALAELKFKELAMVEEEMKMAMQVKQAEVIKDKAQQDYNASRVKKTKFEEVYTTQQRRELIRQDRKEESELDEEMVLRFTKENL
jgi:type III secretion protein O